MKIEYSITGTRRKELATQIGKMLNLTPKYLGVPSFVYEIGDYQVDKNGTLTGEDNLELVSDLQELHDFVPQDEDYDIAVVVMTLVPEEEKTEPIGLTIEVPKQDFTDTALENLQRLIISKGSLLKKALATDNLEIVITDDTISFPWFDLQGNSLAVRAYTHLVTAMCEMAKTQSRINATEKQVDNEKYAFRCFLLRLGFIGNDYKAERKLLLKNLTGSSAFKEVQPK